VVGSLIGLRSIDAMQVKQVASGDEILFSKQVYEDVDKNEWVEFDIEALVQDKEFIQPTIS